MRLRSERPQPIGPSQLQPIQQPAAGHPEQVAHRHPDAFLGQDGVDLGLEAAAQRHQLGPVADQLAHSRTAAGAGLGQPTHAQQLGQVPAGRGRRSRARWSPNILTPAGGPGAPWPRTPATGRRPRTSHRSPPGPPRGQGRPWPAPATAPPGRYRPGRSPAPRLGRQAHDHRAAAVQVDPDAAVHPWGLPRRGWCERPECPAPGCRHRERRPRSFMASSCPAL
jgi:hypothetical protein